MTLAHPLPGRPTPAGGHFGASRSFLPGYPPHTGHDWAAPAGTPVRAAAGGVVTKSDFSLVTGAGHRVHIVHSDRLETRYVHLLSRHVRANQAVAAGTVIGTVGASGTATGNHLHFEALVDGKHVNPIPLLGGAALPAPGAVLANNPAARVCFRVATAPGEGGFNQPGVKIETVPVNADGSCPTGYRGPVNDPGGGLLPGDSQGALGGALGLALPALLEPALNIAILGSAALLIYRGLTTVLKP